MSEQQSSLVDENDRLATDPDSRQATPEAEEPGFGEALSEIERILAEIEGDEIDLDELADALGKAANLLDLCRAKIRRAESEVEQVSQRLRTEDD